MDWLFEFVLKWFVGYLAKVGAAIDWNWFKNKVHAALAPLPDMLEMPLVAIADSAIAALQAAFKDEKNLGELFAALAAQNWALAFKELEELFGAKKALGANVVQLHAAAGRLKERAAKAAEVKLAAAAAPAKPAKEGKGKADLKAG